MSQCTCLLVLPVTAALGHQTYSPIFSGKAPLIAQGGARIQTQLFWLQRPVLDSVLLLKT